MFNLIGKTIRIAKITISVKSIFFPRESDSESWTEWCASAKNITDKYNSGTRWINTLVCNSKLSLAIVWNVVRRVISVTRSPFYRLACRQTRTGLNCSSRCISPSRPIYSFNCKYALGEQFALILWVYLKINFEYRKYCWI